MTNFTYDALKDEDHELNNDFGDVHGPQEGHYSIDIMHRANRTIDLKSKLIEPDTITVIVDEFGPATPMGIVVCTRVHIITAVDLPQFQNEQAVDLTVNYKGKPKRKGTMASGSAGG